MSISETFWKNKRVFITGHTGFKGSWLCLWLSKMGAKVIGYALSPPTEPSLFDLAQINELLELNLIEDICNGQLLTQALQETDPEIVIHMAAQPLVRDSYQIPVETYSTNVMGTVNILEAVRQCDSVRAFINVTTDKCYENQEWLWGYRENEPLGGYDPYSSSKACSELVTAAYRNSFFNAINYEKHRCALATARAGNVLGGGDWARDRLISDCVRSIIAGETISIRNPVAIRPWQHVMEPLSGYLLLAENLYENGPKFAESWNFGPNDEGTKTVEWVVSRLCERWGQEASYNVVEGDHLHEARLLKLDCSKAKTLLNWQPRWPLQKTIDSIADWTLKFQNGEDVRETTLGQIDEYTCWDRDSNG